MRKVVLYIAMTLDGMIADSNDGISFLDPYGDLKWVVDKTNALMDRTDTILMGRRTYEVVQSFDLPWPYTDHQCFVNGQTNLASDVSIMIHENATTHVNKLKQLHGKDIWLMGGGKLTQSLLDAKSIYESRKHSFIMGCCSLHVLRLDGSVDFNILNWRFTINRLMTPMKMLLNLDEFVKLV